MGMTGLTLGFGQILQALQLGLHVAPSPGGGNAMEPPGHNGVGDFKFKAVQQNGAVGSVVVLPAILALEKALKGPYNQPWLTGYHGAVQTGLPEGNLQDKPTAASRLGVPGINRFAAQGWI